MSAGTEDAAAGAGARTRAYRPVQRGGGDARLVCGVCAGLGRATGVDPIVYRVAVVILTVAAGVGVPVYVAGWLLMPAEDQAAAPLEHRLGRQYTTDNVLAILGAIVAAGFLLSLLGGPGGSTLVMLVVLALAVLTAQKRGADIPHLLRNLPAHVRGHPNPTPGAPGTAPGTPPGSAPDAGPAAGASGPPNAGPTTGTTGAAGAGIGAGGAFAAETAMGPRPQTTADAGPRPTAGADPGTSAGAGPDAASERSGRPDGFIDLGAYGRGRGSGAPGAYAASGAAGGQDVTDPYGPTIPFGPGGPGDGYGAGDGPYDLGATRGAPEGSTYRHGSRGHWLGSLFFLAACGAGAWAMATSAPSHGWDGIVTYEYGAAAALLTIGAGLIVGAWFGRTRGLVFWGVLLAIALVALPMVGTGSGSVRGINTHWRPATVAQASRTFHMGVGAGHLDLTRVPLNPKHPLRVNATLKAGALRILVPHKARVRIDGTIGVGDIRSGDRVYGSHDHRVNVTLDPAPRTRGGRTPVIDLHLRGLIGDMEVRRAA